MNWKKIFGVGILLWIVGSVLGWLTCGWLFNWIYTDLSPALFKTSEQMMATANMAIMSLFGLLAGIIFVFVYAVLYKGIPGKGYKRGMMYGFLLWMVTSLVGMISMPTYMLIHWGVVFYWIGIGLVSNLINGAIVGALYK